MKKRGIRIALDDFGTGYSSLTHLKNLPIDIVKLDRTYIKNIEEEKKMQ
ncbi:EAL domain-containing protein [Anaerobacillus sp. HL2]|nr:EAL domain-containing protein [Anaerobacillus sp. HL2]